MRDADDHFRVFLPASKTDVFRLGVHVHLTANESDTCPIAALSAMLEDRSDDMTAESPLFQLEGAPMTRTSLLRGMKVLLLAAGLDPAKYSGHSLRKGGAQSLYDAGVATSDIQTLGRWRSAAFRLYISMTLEVHKRYSELLSLAKPSGKLLGDFD